MERMLVLLRQRGLVAGCCTLAVEGSDDGTEVDLRVWKDGRPTKLPPETGAER